MAESMAEVLAAIIAGVDEANNWDASPEMYQKYADAILAAGFGLVADATLRATDLIRDLIDPDDCHFDHHGGCQAHGYLSLEPGETCPQHDAKEWGRAAVAAACGGGEK